MEYFVLFNPRFNNTAFAYGEEREVNFNTSDSKICQECGNSVSMLEWLPPYEVKVSKKKIGDLIFGTFVGFLASQRFRDEFEKCGLKGLEIDKKVQLYYGKKHLNVVYYYAEIALINAFVDVNRVGFDNGNQCNLCQKGARILNEINGISFTDVHSISEDIFFTTSLGQATIIVSERFKNFIESHQFDNVKLVNAMKYKWTSRNPVEY